YDKPSGSGFNREWPPHYIARHARRINTDFADKSAPTALTVLTALTALTANGRHFTELRQAKWERFQPRMAPSLHSQARASHQHRFRG
ncbi:MAG: hypothetical protein KKI15_16285, partial [Proteobacteria bacterium]|nr:hypothetical protein [Pseudomonadota bacterium]